MGKLSSAISDRRYIKLLHVGAVWKRKQCFPSPMRFIVATLPGHRCFMSHVQFVRLLTFRGRTFLVVVYRNTRARMHIIGYRVFVKVAIMCTTAHCIRYLLRYSNRECQNVVTDNAVKLRAYGELRRNAWVNTNNGEITLSSNKEESCTLSLPPSLLTWVQTLGVNFCSRWAHGPAAEMNAANTTRSVH